VTTIEEHLKLIESAEIKRDNLQAALTDRTKRTLRNQADLRSGVKAQKFKIIAEQKSIELHEAGFNDDQVKRYFKDIAYFNFITNLATGSCSGCTPGVSNISGDIFGSVVTTYTKQYNDLVKTGMISEGEAGFLTPFDLAVIGKPNLTKLFAIRAGQATPNEPIKDEGCFIFANIYRMQGSTLPGADPQKKVLVSSGKISCENADTLRSTGHIIEEIIQDEVSPPIVDNPPQTPFFIDANGNKVYKVELTESITIKESN